jgi:hypothetical protein
LYCIFLLGHLLLSFDHCFVSNVFTKVSFQDVFIELLSLFFYYFVHGNGSGFEYIKHLHGLTKSVLHKYLRFFI